MNSTGYFVTFFYLKTPSRGTKNLRGYKIRAVDFPAVFFFPELFAPINMLLLTLYPRAQTKKRPVIVV